MSAHEATAVLALWNDVSPELDAQYNEWHAVEHVPERLTVPGMLWGRRYGLLAGASPRYFTLYGLADKQVLDSEPYQRLLREPTPMSRAMRPAFANVSRWVCRLHEQSGVENAAILAVRLVDGPVQAASLRYERLFNVRGASGRLIAERLREAKALPWLGDAQGGGMEGDWLLAAAFDASDAAAPALLEAGTFLYRQLPVG